MLCAILNHKAITKTPKRYTALWHNSLINQLSDYASYRKTR